MASITKAFNSLLDGLDERQQEIVLGRFGIGRFEEPQTLAALGERYNITRERVRQLEESAVKSLREKSGLNKICQAVISRSQKYLRENGGVVREDDFLDYHRSFTDDINKNYLILLEEVSGAFNFYPDNKDFWSFFYSEENILEKMKNFLNEWVSFLRAKKEEVLAKARYQEYLKNFLNSKQLQPLHVKNYLKVSKKIHINSYGDIGLAEWPEIKPLTVRDRIYLILKKKNQPLHFREITGSINESNLSHKNVLAPTVHNELIKDKRFVLVGRGIYGLAEHGYEPGTASVVIQRVLKNNGPLKPREIILAVQKSRFFKPNTILVNLQNKKSFERLPDGTYRSR